MELTKKRTVQVTAYLLLALVVAQAVFTALFVSGANVPWPRLWGIESLLFTVLVAFAGVGMQQTRDH